ncbi:MAG: hypothetical protein R3A13_10115 [Bdellovibrionota bacterium]
MTTNDFHINVTSVHSFKTTETGFVLGQLAMKPPSRKQCADGYFVNCAPRQDERTSRKNNEGEGLVYSVLSNRSR